MIKVLILTYYWPPSGGAGVQRWLKFTKYLSEFGIEPIIYTHSNGEVPSIDNSLSKEIPSSVKVLTSEIWEPYSFYKRISGKKNEKINSGFLTETKPKKSFVQDLSIWVRGNFFIPDARKFWIKPSVKYLSDYIRDNHIDVVISTGPPHSMHLIALGLKKKFGIPWISDFRDPWTNIDFYSELKLTRWADKKHHSLEKEVLVQSDVCISVGPTLSKELSDLGAKKCITITNGYDESDILTSNVDLDQKVSIAHIGSFTKSRNPEVLFRVLQEIRTEIPNLQELFELKLVGKVDYTISELIASYELQDIVRKVDYLPHAEVIIEQCKSHALLLVVNETPNAKGILTGKIFEYLAAKRPIIAIAPEGGDLANLVQETNSGIVVHGDDTAILKKLILQLLDRKETEFTFKGVDRYSRKKLTSDLASVIKNLSAKK